MKWDCVTIDEARFIFITNAMEYELSGTYNKYGWRCDLFFYKDAKVNKLSMGNIIASFIAETPEHAKELANKRIPQIAKRVE